jgi:hypothetical protein
MKKFLLISLLGLAAGIGAATASPTCRDICQIEYRACLANATNLSERGDCFAARYECGAQCAL